ncbi:MAG: hypothetical protein ACLQPD_21890 [Desulfomonilaceae bacterium]
MWKKEVNLLVGRYLQLIETVIRSYRPENEDSIIRRLDEPARSNVEIHLLAAAPVFFWNDCQARPDPTRLATRIDVLAQISWPVREDITA